MNPRLAELDSHDEALSLQIFETVSQDHLGGTLGDTRIEISKIVLATLEEVFGDGRGYVVTRFFFCGRGI